MLKELEEVYYNLISAILMEYFKSFSKESLKPICLNYDTDRSN